MAVRYEAYGLSLREWAVLSLILAALCIARVAGCSCSCVSDEAPSTSE